MEKSQLSPGRFIALLMIGVGLVSMGGAAYMFASDSFSAAPTAANNAAPDQNSAVPEQVDYAAPDLTLSDINGRTTSLKDYRGSVVLVNLWATWCPPCRAEMPALQSFYEKYKDDGFVIVSINQEESRELVMPFIEEYGLTFPVWLDLDYEAEKRFGTDSLPASFVIDRSGTVRLMWVGGISEKNLEYYVPNVIYGN